MEDKKYCPVIAKKGIIEIVRQMKFTMNHYRYFQTLKATSCDVENGQDKTKALS